MSGKDLSQGRDGFELDSHRAPFYMDEDNLSSVKAHLLCLLKGAILWGQLPLRNSSIKILDVVKVTWGHV